MSSLSDFRLAERIIRPAPLGGSPSVELIVEGPHAEGDEWFFRVRFGEEDRPGARLGRSPCPEEALLGALVQLPLLASFLGTGAQGGPPPAPGPQLLQIGEPVPSPRPPDAPWGDWPRLVVLGAPQVDAQGRWWAWVEVSGAVHWFWGPGPLSALVGAALWVHRHHGPHHAVGRAPSLREGA